MIDFVYVWDKVVDDQVFDLHHSGVPAAKRIEVHMVPTPTWRSSRKTTGKGSKWLARSGDFRPPAISSDFFTCVRRKERGRCAARSFAEGGGRPAVQGKRSCWGRFEPPPLPRAPPHPRACSPPPLLACGLREHSASSAMVRQRRASCRDGPHGD